MKPNRTQIVRGFWGDEFEDFRDSAISLDYSGTLNPVDGVVYPGIALLNVEWHWKLREKLRELYGSPIDGFRAFMRFTGDNTPKAPNGAHHDATMGDYGMALYMNTGLGGTAIVEHKESDQWQDWARDSNEYDAWRITSMARCIADNAFVYEADVLHRAEPIEGWGTHPANGRLVCVAFRI